jgi:hypothetical protein
MLLPCFKTAGLSFTGLTSFSAPAGMVHPAPHCAAALTERVRRKTQERKVIRVIPLL